MRPLGWGDVEGWAAYGGASLGTRRTIPKAEDLYALARSIETHELDGIVIIGGFQAYRALSRINAERKRFPALSIPIVVLPASLDNNLPGLQMAVGADSALNVDVQAVDRIKQSATASKRAFVVETMGGNCGYLALLAGLSGGAVRVYLHEEGITLDQLNDEGQTKAVDLYNSELR